MTFATRALRNTAVFVILAVALLILNWVYGISLRDTSFLSGWLLLVGVGLLTAYNLRKKLPILPLLSVSVWLQLHIYLGWLTIFLFLLHTSFRSPSGGFEIGLWLLFVAVAGSGVVGLALSRTLPNRLRRHGEAIIFERIPIFRAQLAREVGDLAMQSVTQTASNTIAQYYTSRLQPFFRGPRNVLAHIVGSNEAILRLRREIRSLERYLDESGRETLEIRSLERYLDESGRETLDEIEWRVAAKDNLDQQYALQLLLKGWLFVHVPLTYSLILVAVVHAVLIYAFDGGSL